MRLEPALSSDGLPLLLETSDQTSATNLISSYCDRKGIHCPSDLIYDEKRKFSSDSSSDRRGIKPSQKLFGAQEDHPMQVILQPLVASEGSSVEVDTNSKALLASLVSAYCAQKGIKLESNYTIYDEKKRPLPLYSTLSALGIENGQTLLIGKEDTTFTVLKQWPIVVALATIAIGIIGIVAMSLVYGLKGGKYFDDYGVVMDAGSSKTNTIVYKWRSSKHRGTGRVSQEENCYAKGGVAKMDPMHLEPVIDCAINVTSVIAPKSLPKTPLFLAATAGMRLLELTDPDRVKRILQNLEEELPKTGLDLKAVEIISGRDEGIYGWITTNYILQTLELPQKLDPWEPSTHGALDMGGASLQISYAVPNNAVVNDSSDVMDIQLYGQTFSVFSQSNLCFGRDEAENRFKSLLLQKRNGTTIYNPCAPKEYRELKNGSELFAPICSNHSIDDIQNIKNTVFTFVGTGDPASCSRSVSQLLNESLCTTLKFKECFKKVTGLPDNQKFLAFATYYYTTSFLKIDDTTLENYENTMNSFCQKTIDEVNKIADKKYGPQYCFNAQYIHEVLINGFGFTSDTWKNIEFKGEIGGKDIGWTLGYMINATNIIPVKATPRLISTSSLTVSLVFFIIIIAATAVFLLYTYKKNLNSS